MADPTTSPPADLVPAGPAWQLRWLTPSVCRALFALVVVAGFLGHLSYLHNHCPIDLSGDEAQYWDWSRQLDLSYYSKGPLVAYIIRASCAIFGDTMPAVRYPAVLLGAMTSAVTYLLARKLFRSDRIALGATLLYPLVPMFVAGSVLMTIDPPFFFCWATATYLLAVAMFDGKRWAWPAIGVVVGVGFLAKYAMFLWFLSMLLALAADRPSRPLLRTRWPWLAVAIAAAFTTPVIVWNARHEWVSLGHVSTQTGANGAGKFSLPNVLEFTLGQAGIVGPAMAVIMVAAAVFALRRRRDAAADSPPAANPFPRQARFLAVVGVTFFAITFLDAFRTKVQMNWPAPAYFTLMILSAYFLSTRLADRRLWKPWRPWFYFAVAFGLVTLPIGHNPEVLYPAVAWLKPKVDDLRARWAKESGVKKAIAKRLPSDALTARQFDFTAKLKGWAEFSQSLSDELDKLGPGAFALTHDYQQSAELAFHLRGQPKTHYAGSYYHDDPGRMTQYDVWPDRRLTPDTPLVGRNAVFLGRHPAVFPDLAHAFDRVVGPIKLKPRRVLGLTLTLPMVTPFIYEANRGGMPVQTFRYFVCYGFKGMTRPAGPLPK